MKVFLTAILLSLLTFSSPAAAFDYPRYEGVYVRLKDDTLVQLIGNSGLPIRIYETRPRISIVETNTSWDARKLENFPVIDPGEVVSFIINSRHEQSFFLDKLVEIHKRFPGSTGQWDEHLSSYNASLIYERYPIIQSPTSLVRTRCGWNRENGLFGVINVSSFVTEFELRYDLPTYAHDFNNCGGEHSPIDIYGFTLKYGDTQYPFFTVIGKEFTDILIEESN